MKRLVHLRFPAVIITIQIYCTIIIIIIQWHLILKYTIPTYVNWTKYSVQKSTIHFFRSSGFWYYLSFGHFFIHLVFNFFVPLDLVCCTSSFVRKKHYNCVFPLDYIVTDFNFLKFYIIVLWFSSTLHFVNWKSH